jgi:regulatory protein
VGGDKREELGSAKKLCLRLLAYRPRSERELTLRLAKRGFSPRMAQLTLGWLRRSGLADDREFARWWVESRKGGGKTGRRGLEWELRAKGVERELAAEVVESGMDEEEEIRIGLEAAARRRAREGAAAAGEGRLLRWMRRRGFSPEAIEEIMRRSGRPDW